jgi:hypothetical protein
MSKLCPRAWWGSMFSTQKKLSDNCKKDGDFFEKGTFVTMEECGKIGKEMKKRRREQAWDFAKKGELENIDADIRIRSYGTRKKIRRHDALLSQNLEIIQGELQNECGWGPAGTGK